MTETFKELCDRVDANFKQKTIKPSDYIVMMREYDTWKSDNKPEKKDG